MGVLENIKAYEDECSAGSRPIKRQLTIELCDIREVLSLASALSSSLRETAQEFAMAVERHYSSDALGNAIAFRLQRDALLRLKRMYEEETDMSSEETGCFFIHD